MIRGLHILVLVIGFSFLTACAESGSGESSDSSLENDDTSLPDFGTYSTDPDSLEGLEDEVADTFGEEEGAALLDAIFGLNLDSSADDPNQMFKDLSQAITFLLAQRDARINQEIQLLAKWMEEQIKTLKKSKKKSDFRRFFKEVAKRLTRCVHRAIDKHKGGKGKK